MWVAADFSGMPAGHGLARFADVPYCQRRDGPPELVVRREYSVIAVPVLPRRRDEIGQAVQKLEWRKLDDAIGPRGRGLSAAAPPDPVGRLVSREQVTDASDPAVNAADHGQPFECEGRPGAIPQKMFETPKIARHVAVDECDPDARID
jgi:hypothetical protein